MNCLCQRVYDTGFTGNPKIDARLAHQYEVYGQDCIKRAFDHDARTAPYTEVPRSPYCFVQKRKGNCRHHGCEWARYRAPDTVRKMRWWIETEACKAHVHYPSMLDSHNSQPEIPVSAGSSYESWGESKYGVPQYKRRHRRLEVDGVNRKLTGLVGGHHDPNDAHITAAERWEDEMFRLHRYIHPGGKGCNTTEDSPYEKHDKGERNQLPATYIGDFRDYVAECLYGVDSLDRGTELDYDEQGRNLERLAQEALDRYLDGTVAEDWTDEQLQSYYENEGSTV